VHDYASKSLALGAGLRHLHLPVGLQGYFQQTSTDWSSLMALSVARLLSSVIIYAVLNGYFSVVASVGLPSQPIGRQK
jgi:ABC-type glycerol-3-phosphate transport system permease component